MPGLLDPKRRRFEFTNAVARGFGQDPTSHIPYNPAADPEYFGAQRREVTQFPMQPPQDEGGGGVGGLLNRILFGPDDPRLSKQENKNLRGRALQQASYKMAMAGGRGHDSLTTPQALAMLLGGVQQERRDLNLQEVYQNLIDSGDPNALLQIAQIATAQGDDETARQAAYAYQVQKQGMGIEGPQGMGGGPQAPALQRKEGINPDTGRNEQYVFNPADGSVQWLGIPTEQKQRAAQRFSAVNPETSRMEVALFDPNTREITFPGVESKSTELTPKQRAEAADLQSAAAEVQAELAIIQDFVDKHGAPGRWAAGAGIPGTDARIGLPAEMQANEFKRFQGAAANILSIVVKSRSGAQATEAEVRRLEKVIMPLPGDGPDVLKEKLRRMKDIADRLQRGADAMSGYRDSGAADSSAGGDSTPAAGGGTNAPASGVDALSGYGELK